MKKFLGLAVIGLLSLVLAYAVSAQEAPCSSSIHGHREYFWCVFDGLVERPNYIPDSANEKQSCFTFPDGRDWCETAYFWSESLQNVFPISPLPTPFVSPLPIVSPLPTPVPEKEKSVSVPQSGYVGSVWVPVYGISCDQLGGSADCMCFYNADTWCPN